MSKVESKRTSNRSDIMFRSEKLKILNGVLVESKMDGRFIQSVLNLAAVDMFENSLIERLNISGILDENNVKVEDGISVRLFFNGLEIKREHNNGLPSWSVILTKLKIGGEEIVRILTVEKEIESSLAFDVIHIVNELLDAVCYLSKGKFVSHVNEIIHKFRKIENSDVGKLFNLCSIYMLLGQKKYTQIIIQSLLHDCFTLHGLFLLCSEDHQVKLDTGKLKYRRPVKPQIGEEVRRNFDCGHLSYGANIMIKSKFSCGYKINIGQSRGSESKFDTEYVSFDSLNITGSFNCSSSSPFSNVESKEVCENESEEGDELIPELFQINVTRMSTSTPVKRGDVVDTVSKKNVEGDEGKRIFSNSTCERIAKIENALMSEFQLEAKNFKRVSTRIAKIIDVVSLSSSTSEVRDVDFDWILPTSIFEMISSRVTEVVDVSEMRNVPDFPFKLRKVLVLGIIIHFFDMNEQIKI